MSTNKADSVDSSEQSKQSKQSKYSKHSDRPSLRQRLVRKFRACSLEDAQDGEKKQKKKKQNKKQKRRGTANDSEWLACLEPYCGPLAPKGSVTMPATRGSTTTTTATIARKRSSGEGGDGSKSSESEQPQPQPQSQFPLLDYYHMRPLSAEHDTTSPIKQRTTISALVEENLRAAKSLKRETETMYDQQIRLSNLKDKLRSINVSLVRSFREQNRVENEIATAMAHRPPLPVADSHQGGAREADDPVLARLDLLLCERYQLRQSISLHMAHRGEVLKVWNQDRLLFNEAWAKKGQLERRCKAVRKRMTTEEVVQCWQLSMKQWKEDKEAESIEESEEIMW